MQYKTQNVEENSIDHMECLIKSIKSVKTMTDEQIADDLGYNEKFISQTRSRKDVSPKFIKRLQDYLGRLQNAKEVGGTELYKQPLNANSDLKKLIDANHMLAQSVLIDARNRENLTESNRELTKKVTANAQSQNEQAVDAMRSAFLELLSQVGSGKRFHSAEELKTAYRKLVSVALVPEGEGDTRNNLDKKRIVK